MIGPGGSRIKYQVVKYKLSWKIVLPISWSNLALWISQIKFRKFSLAFTRKLSRTDLQNEVKATSKPHRTIGNYKSIGVCHPSESPESSYPTALLRGHYNSFLISVRAWTKCPNKPNIRRIQLLNGMPMGVQSRKIVLQEYSSWFSFICPFQSRYLQENCNFLVNTEDWHVFDMILAWFLFFNCSKQKSLGVQSKTNPSELSYNLQDLRSQEMSDHTTWYAEN